jgi:XTP/dITP diphosphohydrolase
MSKKPLVLVTQNEHKITELTPLFKDFGVSFTKTDLEKTEIRSDDVRVVAKEAAKLATSALGQPVVVDDTGLFISSLNGFPRSYPAFVLETIGLDGILRLLEGVEDRSAYFITAVGYADQERVMTFVGKMHGYISESAIGQAGFGYDPIFIPENLEKTYAQLTSVEKVSISHRTRAFRDFLKWYTSNR